MAATVAMLALVGTLAQPASAEDLPVSGLFTASGNFEFQCEFAQEFLEGSGDWTSLGAVDLVYEFCVQSPANFDDPWPITRGTFTITASDGTLTGDIGGFVMAGQGFVAPGELTFSITGGTERYAQASGSLVLDALFEYVPPQSRNMTGSVSGTVTLPSPMPTSKDDCKHGGWQELADENGEPFRNQGQCIAWVNRNT